MKEARRRLRVAYHTQGPECFEKIAAALTGFLADKQNLPSASIDSHTAQAVLKDAGVPEDLSAEFVTCLERCDLARFGGGAAGTDRSDRLKQADRLLARLGKELR
jgi:hypothetical protein